MGPVFNTHNRVVIEPVTLTRSNALDAISENKFAQLRGPHSYWYRIIQYADGSQSMRSSHHSYVVYRPDPRYPYCTVAVLPQALNEAQKISIELPVIKDAAAEASGTTTIRNEGGVERDAATQEAAQMLCKLAMDEVIHGEDEMMKDTDEGKAALTLVYMLRRDADIRQYGDFGSKSRLTDEEKAALTLMQLSEHDAAMRGSYQKIEMNGGNQEIDWQDEGI